MFNYISDREVEANRRPKIFSAILLCQPWYLGTVSQISDDWKTRETKHGRHLSCHKNEPISEYQR